MSFISDLVNRQRSFYRSGKTRSYAFRMEALSKLRQGIIKYEEQLNQGLKADLNKSPCETYLCETGLVLDEIRFQRKHLHKWMKKRRVRGSMGQLPGRCYQSPEPYGVTLLMSPWNYPVQLCFIPLIGAISGGNTAIIKPSAYAPASSAAIAALIADVFPPEYIAVVEGGRQQNSTLLQQKVDYIFFTGSVAVGKTVMAAAAEQLIPVTLELGGKSPVIVDESANIPLAAKRIAFGKTVNAGQTCVEPDYLLVQETVREQFVSCYRDALAKFFPAGDMSQMVTIISQKHYERLKRLLADGQILIGGGYDDTRRYIEPTLIEEVSFDDSIMQEEIFGPMLPLFSYSTLEECTEYITARDKPLALYLFSQNKENIRAILDTCSFGGGCINDTMLHLANPRMPFGGVGASGMGSYHGKKSFDTFTHQRSVFHQSGKLDVPIRYMPFTDRKLALLRKIMR